MLSSALFAATLLEVSSSRTSEASRITSDKGVGEEQVLAQKLKMNLECRDTRIVVVVYDAMHCTGNLTVELDVLVAWRSR